MKDVIEFYFHKKYKQINEFHDSASNRITVSLQHLTVKYLKSKSVLLTKDKAQDR